MFISLLFSLLPTVLVYSYLQSKKLLTSKLLLLSLSWFVGQYLSAIVIFVIAGILHFVTTAITLKATIIYLSVLTALAIGRHRQLMAFLKSFRAFRWQAILSFKTLMIVGCLLFSYSFFAPHLAQYGRKIYTSPVYWDFKLHMPMIQNFALGDNVPPENESFSGVPLTYHFFWAFLVSIYSAAGLGLVAAVQTVSILSFFMLLVTILGLGEEFFSSFGIGALAVVLTITSSSLRFLYEDPFELVRRLFTNTGHPYFFSFIPGNPFGYNGTMFNLFYFLVENQMIIGVLFLLLAVAIFSIRERFTSATAFFVGAVMGFFFLWHVFITLMIFASLVFLLVFDKEKKKTLALLLGFGAVVFCHSVYLQLVSQSSWFYSDSNSYPRINFKFPTMNQEYPFSVSNALFYYIFAYGLKIVLLPVGLYGLWKTKRRLFFLLASIILPTFVLVNTVQLAPLSIYENHKWLRPMNVVVDIVVATFLYRFFGERQKRWRTLLGIFTLVILTLSGLIELRPFQNSRASEFFVDLDSPIRSAILGQTPPGSTFVGRHGLEIQSAGRKLFLGDYVLPQLPLDKNRRREIIKKLYVTTDSAEFCTLSHDFHIDYVEYDGDNEAKQFLGNWRQFQVMSDTGAVVFVDAKSGC